MDMVRIASQELMMTQATMVATLMTLLVILKMVGILITGFVPVLKILSALFLVLLV